MKILAFATLKGGVGKSSCLFNIAGMLAEEGKKILVLDADPQGNATNNFGIDRTKSDLKGIKEIIEDSINFNDVVIKNPCVLLPSIDVIPASIFLTATELRLVGLAGRENVLKNYFEKNLEYFNQYDYVLIDTNPSMGIINQNCFVLASDIILVSDVSMNSMEGAELFSALWEEIRERINLKDNITGFIINNFDKRTRLAKDFREYCLENEQIKDIIFSTVIPNNIKIKESELSACPINMYHPKGAGHEAYIELVEEMKTKGVL